MKKSVIKIAEKLQTHYGEVFIVSFLIWTVAAAVFFATKDFKLWHLIFVPVSFIILCESILRLILYTAYGSQYKNSIFVYFLVDHSVYGNAFRKSCYAKKLNFFIFDKYIFPFKTGRILDLGKNIELRNDFNINSLGFRSGEFDPYKKAAKLRIFCSGGSTTACNSVDDDETWPHYLGLCLKQKGYAVEVINAGVQRWVSYQESLRFRDEISEYQPDVMLLNQGLNDEFEFSCLFPQNKWRPRTTLNVRETRNLYSSHHPILSSPVFLSIFLAIQFFFKHFYFARNMKFTNPERWRNFSRNDYIVAWFDNMIDIAGIAKEKGTLLYNIGYPLLVDMADSEEERRTYIANSRLDSLYADYQAISKKKIVRTIQTASQIIPILEPDEYILNSHKGIERLGLFTDEFHMTVKGNKIFAESLCEKLISDSGFQKRYQGYNRISQESNVNLDRNLVQEARKTLQNNSPFLDRLIKEKIRMLEAKNSKKKHISEVPEDQYTTF